MPIVSLLRADMSALPSGKKTTFLWVNKNAENLTSRDHVPTVNSYVQQWRKRKPKPKQAMNSVIGAPFLCNYAGGYNTVGVASLIIQALKTQLKLIQLRMGIAKSGNNVITPRPAALYQVSSLLQRT
jgi:hypothetical protein